MINNLFNTPPCYNIYNEMPHVILHMLDDTWMITELKGGRHYNGPYANEADVFDKLNGQQLMDISNAILGDSNVPS